MLAPSHISAPIIVPDKSSGQMEDQCQRRGEGQVRASLQSNSKCSLQHHQQLLLHWSGEYIIIILQYNTYIVKALSYCLRHCICTYILHQRMYPGRAFKRNFLNMQKKIAITLKIIS